MKKKIQGMMAYCLVLFFVSPAAAFTLRPPWVPQTQFAGYYMAAEKGFYEKEGIDITIKHGEPSIMAIREVIAGDTDFAIAWLIQGLQFSARGEKLVHIGQFFQKNSLLLITRKSGGIDSVEKFSGHTLGVWQGDFQIPPRALLRKYNIRNVKVINQSFTMEPFLAGEVEIASAMRYNEYHQVLESGIRPEEIIIFSYSDLGMNLPEDGAYVREDFYQKHPDVCKKFIRASLEGWKYAFAHKDETVRMMTRLANATEFRTTEKKQRIMLDEVEKVIDPDSAELKKEDFQTALDILKSARIVKNNLDYKTFTRKP